MANLKASKKSARKDEKRRVQNKALKTRIKNLTKKMLEEKDPEKKKSYLNLLYSFYDKAVKRNIVKKNTASRKKSKLTKIVMKQLQPQGK
jgi:small subunit ribosomal protein S20|uniref:Small ribosomal subunit protein bS20 n=1 Tax=candidate division WOR-3 bacterium TaxID=2052148 RepID=A0A7C4U642_UNCW3